MATAEISARTRRHRGTGNLEHRPRDTVLARGRPAGPPRQRPPGHATLRNLALGLFAIHGVTKIKQTVQSIGRNPIRAIPLIT